METILQFSRWLHDLPDVPKTFVSIILIWFFIWLGIRVYMALRFVLRLIVPKRKKKTATPAVKSFPKVPDGCKVYVIKIETGNVVVINDQYSEDIDQGAYFQTHALSGPQAIRKFNNKYNPESI